MKRVIWVFVALLIICGVAAAILDSMPRITLTEQEVKLKARRASVQPMFYLPVMKIWFTDPIITIATTPTHKELQKKVEELEKLIQAKIDQALEDMKKPTHETTLTTLDVYGVEPPSKTFIPLGMLAPKWAKFPERVLVVAKVEKQDIKPWERKHEKDVLSISEVAEVSISKAQTILSRLSLEGYTVSKQEVRQAETVELLWYDDGWDDRYPLPLSWSVELEGKEDNIIIGYDSRGILEVRPIPDDTRVHVKAGYLDLLERPKSDEVKGLENQIKSLQEDLDRAREELIEERLKHKKEPDKRDITKATFADLMYGTVKLQRFWVLTGGSGVFLGNMRSHTDMFGVRIGPWHNVEKKEAGVVLTNAHVIMNALIRQIFVTPDKEVMYITGRSVPYIRYTKGSDKFGTPAAVLFMDQAPVISTDFDSAILVTTAIPQYEQHKATLGDSDKVEEGTPVVMAGNPGAFTKFLTRGVIARKDFSFRDHIAYRNMKTQLFLNSSFWIDAPIGMGGTSGSGVWALSGSQKGKVVSMHNGGLISPNMAVATFEGTEESHKYFLYSARISETKNIERAFKSWDHRDAEFRIVSKEEDPDLWKAVTKGHSDVPGMSCGIPINIIKAWMQERGLSPEKMGFESVAKRYWER